MALAFPDPVLVPVDEIDIAYGTGEQCTVSQNEGLAGTQERAADVGISVEDGAGITGKLMMVS